MYRTLLHISDPPTCIYCENSETAEELKEAMKNQWYGLVYPGRKVKVRVKDELVDGEVETCHYIAKLSFDCFTFTPQLKLMLESFILVLRKTFNLETCFCRCFCR